MKCRLLPAVIGILCALYGSFSLAQVGVSPLACPPESASKANLSPTSASSSENPSTSETQGPIAAWVGQEPISAAAVDRLVRQSVGKQAVSPLAHAVLQAQALEELIAQRLVLLEAERKGQTPKPAEIDAAVAELEKLLARQKSSLREYLQSEKISLADLRRRLSWELYWPRRRREEMTQDRLEKYFQAHRRNFDGTEILVSHILLKYPDPPPPSPLDRPEAVLHPAGLKETHQKLLVEAERIRREIVSGRLDFAEAARRYSQAPTAADGGRIGWIGRLGPMVESFAKAAFALEAGQVSPPVFTPFGVHLIRCDQVRPGQKQFDEVRAEVERALARQILQEIAAAQRRWMPVRYTGVTPYWDPKTGQLVLP